MKSWVEGSLLAGISLLALLSCQEGEVTWERHWEKSERFFQEKKYAKAEEELKSALKQAELFDPKDVRLSQTLTRLAAVYDAQSLWGQAQPLLERVLQIHQKVLGDDHIDLAVHFLNLGALHLVQHHFDEAHMHLEKALWIREGALGPDHPEIKNDLWNVIGSYVSRIQYRKAGPFLTRTLSVSGIPVSDASVMDTDSHDDFSKLYTAQNQHEMAKPYLE